MSSVFKASCIIFWLTWLIGFSYLMASVKFVDNHVMADDLMRKNLLIMAVVCYVTIGFSFFGCILMKCDVRTVCCTLLFVLPTGILLPGVSIYGAVTVSKVKSPSPEQALAFIKKYFKQHSEFPHWLTQIEEEFDCCGINGPQDYRAIYISLGQRECEKYEHDITCTCCAHSREEMLEGSVNCIKQKDSKHCKFKGSTDWMNGLVHTESVPAAGLSLQEKCSLNPKDLLIKTHVMLANGEEKTLVNGQGCYGSLKKYYEMMDLWILIFFVILSICSFLMVIVFLKNVCKASFVSGQPSDYSLDVESIAILNSGQDAKQSMAGLRSGSSSPK